MVPGLDRLTIKTPQRKTKRYYGINLRHRRTSQQKAVRRPSEYKKKSNYSWSSCPPGKHLVGVEEGTVGEASCLLSKIVIAMMEKFKDYSAQSPEAFTPQRASPTRICSYR